MTPKTKATGFVCENWHFELTKYEGCSISRDAKQHWTEPVCLLSPSTIDKVRDWLMGFRQLGVPENVQAAELLKLLPDCE